MDERSWADRLAAVAALDHPVSRALYTHVARSQQPVGRDAAAKALGLTRSTTATHLDKLAAVGLLDVEFERLTGRQGPGAGRPAKLYRKAADELALNIPERHYDLVGDILAGAIEHAERTDQPVQDAINDLAKRVGQRIGADTGSLPRALETYGFHPRPDDRVTPKNEPGWLLTNCPFHQLATRHRELICGLNLNLIRGIIKGARSPHTARLQPCDNQCCVRLIPRSR